MACPGDFVPFVEEVGFFFDAGEIMGE